MCEVQKLKVDEFESDGGVFGEVYAWVEVSGRGQGLWGMDRGCFRRVWVVQKGFRAWQGWHGQNVFADQVPRLGVAGFGSRVGFGYRRRLGVEVACLGVGFGGALGGGGRRAMPRRRGHGVWLGAATLRHQGGCLSVVGWCMS
ncbi:hypothetical protein PIB30_086677 [Stylosanthes scabra]|uniref:Uncharacterized protein n=1 Tax=Stylosanthes scabra TaxID=79078 RepID=A0ABU6TTY1_9FABA|nr:hypothetical protein [Stylosanthes scabra]